MSCQLDRADYSFKIGIDYEKSQILFIVYPDIRTLPRSIPSTGRAVSMIARKIRWGYRLVMQKRRKIVKNVASDIGNALCIMLISSGVDSRKGSSVNRKLC